MNATNIAGHSVRTGMATQAALNGSSERAIARTSRHRSRRVLRRYIRPGEMFHENASASLGLQADSRRVPAQLAFANPRITLIPGNLLL
jgi:hypothetical protein